MSGKIAFISGASLICVTRCFVCFMALFSGQPWFYSAIGAGIALNLAYCAWRGERWAYYLLMLLGMVGLVAGGMLIVAAKGLGELIRMALPLGATLSGLVILAVHPGSKAFLEEQRARFGACGN